MEQIEKKTILIVDDNEELADVIKSALEDRGYQAVTAHNGVIGLYQVGKFRPDLIILDYRMPRMDGLDFLHGVSENEGQPKCPVLVISAFSDYKDAFREGGVNGFLEKPFSLVDLEHEIERILVKQTV